MKLTINIDVPDLDRAIAFYTQAIGLRLARHLFEGSVAEMAGATSTIYLLMKPAGTTPVATSATKREYRRHWTPVHLDFEVDDVEVAVRCVLEAGGTLEGEITCYEWGKLATMRDPFGHGFCVLDLSASGYDAAASR